MKGHTTTEVQPSTLTHILRAHIYRTVFDGTRAAMIYTILFCISNVILPCDIVYQISYDSILSCLILLLVVMLFLLSARPTSSVVLCLSRHRRLTHTL